MMANNNGKSSLFIGDLAIFCSEREIEDAFSPYGEIQEIKIMRSEETSRNLSYGFIKFSSALAAKRAMTELNGVILCGRPLRIRWATYKSKVGSKEPKQDVLETSPVHVSFISYQIDKLVTEESLRELFSKYGLVVDASIKKSMIDTDVRRQSGYGFVHYSITGEGIHAAIRAASSLDDITVESVNYKCSLSHNLNKYLTGELSMPAEDSQIPGRPLSNNLSNNMHNGYQEDLGLVDSEQFFHSPPQPQAQQMYNVSMPPPGAGGPQMYRPGGNNPLQLGMNNGYQNQFAPPSNSMYPLQQRQLPPQQQLPKYVSQVPQAARNRPQSGPPLQQAPQQQLHGAPGRPRSMNGYQDLQNQLQQSQGYGNNQNRMDPQQGQFGGRYENPPLDSRYQQQQGPGQSQNAGMYGRPSTQQSSYGGNNNNLNMNNNMNNNMNMYEMERDPHQQLQGVFARGNLAQQRASQGTNNNNNLLSAAVNGAFQQNQQQNQQQHQQQGQSQYLNNNGYDRAPSNNNNNSNRYSMGNLNMNNNQFQEHVGNIGVQGQLRSGVAPSGYNQQQPQARVVSAPNLMGPSGQNGANNPANRWSTGSYNVTSPSSSPSSVMPSVMPPQPHQGRPLPVGKPGMGMSQPQYAPGPNTNYNNNNNMNNMSNNGYIQPPQQQQAQNYNNNFNSNDYGQNGFNTNDLNANFNNLNVQSQHTMSSQFNNAYPLNTSMYNNNGNNNNNFVPNGLVVLSPPPSPLQPYGASPLVGAANLFNPFQQGFSPLFTSVQGQLSPYVAAPGMPGMSPLLSPGQLIPRDVMFEENMSNVHNLFTPATAYYQGSPAMALNDAHYSPAMFQGNFTTAGAAGNGFGNNNNEYANNAHNNANNANAPFDVKHYANQRKSVSLKNRFNSSGGGSSATSPTAAAAAATASKQATKASATAEVTSAVDASPDAAASSTVGAESTAPTTASAAATAATTADADTASPNGFFANLDEGSPLEPETERESDLAQCSELDTSSPDVASSESPLGAPPGMSLVPPAATVAGSVAESPNKGVGSARRSMIMKHAKQLVA